VREEKSIRGKFIGEKIEVNVSDDDPRPLSFIWNSKRYEIIEIIRSWQDYGYSSAAYTRNWRTRRHRNVYLIDTDRGERFEIYLDRGFGKKDWYIYKRL